MRLFIALNIPERSKVLLKRKVDLMINKVEQDLKWVYAKNWHLTLKFLGEVKQQKLDSIKRILTEVTNDYYKFPILFKNVGAFPHLNYPKVIFIDIERGKKQLQQINHDLEQMLVEKGFKADDKEYTPHLTITRSRKNTDFKQLTRDLKRYKEPNFINIHMKAENISIIKSELSPEGPVYEELFNISLKSNRE